MGALAKSSSIVMSPWLVFMRTEGFPWASADDERTKNKPRLNKLIRIFVSILTSSSKPGNGRSVGR
jgi:hypothetical protein